MTNETHFNGYSPSMVLNAETTRNEINRLGNSGEFAKQELYLEYYRKTYNPVFQSELQKLRDNRNILTYFHPNRKVAYTRLTEEIAKIEKMIL
jgi:hypothetical protein